jgi:hypothetical protein
MKCLDYEDQKLVESIVGIQLVVSDNLLNSVFTKMASLVFLLKPHQNRMIAYKDFLEYKNQKLGGMIFKIRATTKFDQIRSFLSSRGISRT